MRLEASSHPNGQHAIRSTVSVGVAISDEEYSDLSALLAAGDGALSREGIGSQSRGAVTTSG